MKAICSLQSKHFKSRKLIKKGFRVHRVNRMLPLMVMSGCIKEYMWNVKPDYGRSYKTRSEIVYERNFKIEEIEKYLNDMDRIYKDKVDGIANKRSEVVSDGTQREPVQIY